MLTVYGLKSCDTCRKARRWLDEAGLAHDFYDLRADGPDAARLRSWVGQAGWERLLNRRGTTWRGLDEAARGPLDAERAVALMREHPALVKRPVFELDDGSVLVGFEDSVKTRLRASGGG